MIDETFRSVLTRTHGCAAPTPDWLGDLAVATPTYGRWGSQRSEGHPLDCRRAEPTVTGPKLPGRSLSSTWNHVTSGQATG